MTCLRTFRPLLLLSVAAFCGGRNPAWSALPAESPELDPLSSDCMSCHDGSGGYRVRYRLPAQNVLEGGGHVVGVVYDERILGEKNFHPSSSLPSEMVLPDGRISCITCHGYDPHWGEPLVIDNIGSSLCRSCHRR